MSIDLAELRNAFGRFPTGVTIVTTLSKGQPIGFTANSFTSVSLHPPLLLVCPGKQLSSIEAFQNCESFGVSILSEGQEELATHFATFKGDRFENTEWFQGKNGVPLIKGAASLFACSTHQILDAGDHILLLGEVIEFDQMERRGLGFLSGKYFSLGLEAKAGEAHERARIVGAVLEKNGSVYLQKQGSFYALPSITVENRQADRSRLQEALERLGLYAEIGRVYSIFESKDGAKSYCYFNGKVMRAKGNHDFVPIDKLHKIAFSSEADRSILLRFANEYQHRNYGLYIGDEDAGELHLLDETRD